jgi:hypothetical protein
MSATVTTPTQQQQEESHGVEQHGRNVDDNILAWRRDPEESFSDWTIEVVVDDTNNHDHDHDHDDGGGGGDDEYGANRNEESSQREQQPSASSTRNIYHVHRVYLASGPRKSEYFKTLFSTQVSTSERLSQTSKLVLPPTACDAFPLVLDYVYGDEEHLELTKGTVVALHYLADYLQVQTLVPITTSYIKASLTETNVHLFCREALLYKIDWVIKSCIHVAAYSPSELTLPVAVVGATTKSTNNTMTNGEESDHNDATTLSCTSLSPAQQTMAMLPPQQQIELLQLSLAKAVNELKQFKRVPSRWNENINDARATHVPTLMRMEYPMQGLTIPFPGRVCPIFYFDNIDAACSSNDGNNSSSSSSSPLASDPPTVGVATAGHVPYNLFSAAHGVNIQPRTPSNFRFGLVSDED